MTTTSRRLRARAVSLGAFALAGVLALAGASPAAAEVGPPPDDWPVFGYQGIITDKSEMNYNPSNEYIFPSVFHAGEYFDAPLGEWYLYTAPHDDPGGIVLMYADSLEGPWTEYASNPVVSNNWQPYYGPVPHVSSPDAFWNADEQKMFLYFHGNNSVTRYATSDDGITFTYGGVAVSNAMGDVDGKPRVTESSYARVFDHPDPDSPYNYAMFYMANDDTPVGGGLTGIRRIRLAESVDGRNWVVSPTPVVEPGEEEGANVSGPNLWEHDGQLYVLYHASSGKSYARTIDKTLREVGETPILLHEASGIGSDVGRVASPEIVTDGGETYLFYEAGDRLGATIAWAKAGAETVVDPPFGGFPEDAANPVFETCAAAGSDEFDGQLADVWTRTIREEAARHVVDAGALQIPTYSGGVSAAPLLQQPLPNGSWQVTTKVSLDPTLNYQQAGILLYASDTDYVKFDLGKATPGRVVELVSAGTAPFTTQSRQDASEVWLRLTSDGSQIEASVSYDGTSFDVFGSRIDALKAGTPRFSHVGPFAFRGGANVAELTATFDWFRFSPSAAQYDECTSPDPDPDPTTDPDPDPTTSPDPDPTTSPDPDPTTDPGAGEETSAALTYTERAPGQSQTVVGTGFEPGESVTGVMYSEPLALGTQIAGADGSVRFAWTIPLGTEPGIHTVVLTGADSGEVRITFRIVGSDLASTGGVNPAPLAVAGGLLLLLGGAAAFGAHRRRTGSM